MELQTFPSSLRASQIVAGVGRNPRTVFSSAEMEELLENIRMRGILQPLLCRPRDDGRFELIAGERRLRCMVNLHGPEVEIPVLIKEMDDEAAHAAATSENLIRAGMTPVEEAEACAKVLASCLGDRAEAARILGFTQPVFDRRVSLMQATDSVRQALQEGKILLGHAELLAVLRNESQEAGLATLLKDTELRPVATFKAQLERLSLSLVKAIFDKADCVNCGFNSGNQGALFAETISEGNCTNKPCYDAKTEGALQSRVASLSDEYQRVRIVRAGDVLSFVPLETGGAKGVGEEQAQACRSCENFGAVVHATADRLGQVSKDQCMDTACNVKMAAANIRRKQAETNQKMMAQSATAGTNASSAVASPQDAAVSKGASASNVGTKGKDNDTKNVEPSKALREYREMLWRAVFARVATHAEPATNRCILLAVMLQSPRVVDSTGLSNSLQAMAIDVKGSGIGQKLDKALLLSDVELSRAISQVAGNLQKDMPITDIVAMLKVLAVDLAEHWKVSSDFFNTLTKNEIDAVCTELGIKAAMGAEYAKAQTGKKDDYIKAILNVQGFEYKGKIPKQVRWK
jgi:ParB family chromosome partitioning protein